MRLTKDELWLYEAYLQAKMMSQGSENFIERIFLDRVTWNDYMGSNPINEDSKHDYMQVATAIHNRETIEFSEDVYYYPLPFKPVGANNEVEERQEYLSRTLPIGMAVDLVPAYFLLEEVPQEFQGHMVKYMPDEN